MHFTQYHSRCLHWTARLERNDQVCIYFLLFFAAWFHGFRHVFMLQRDGLGFQFYRCQVSDDQRPPYSTKDNMGVYFPFETFVWCLPVICLQVGGWIFIDKSHGRLSTFKPLSQPLRADSKGLRSCSLIFFCIILRQHARAKHLTQFIRLDLINRIYWRKI